MEDDAWYFFGEDYADLRLQPCLVEAQERSRKRNLLYGLDLPDLEARLLKDTSVFEGRLLDQCDQLDAEGFSMDPEWEARIKSVIGDKREDELNQLQIWYAKYKTFEPDQPERDWSVDRKKHMQWLFRYALAEEGPEVYKKYHFSYCQSTWYTDFDIHHCVACKTCRDRYEWHCGACRKCAGHYKFPCDGCGGVSSTVFSIREDNKRRIEAEKRAATSSAVAGRANPSPAGSATSGEGL